MDIYLKHIKKICFTRPLRKKIVKSQGNLLIHVDGSRIKYKRPHDLQFKCLLAKPTAWESEYEWVLHEGGVT